MVGIKNNFINKIMLLICIFSSIIFANDSLVKQIEILEKHKHYILSRQKLQENLNQGNSEKLLKLWMSMDKSLYNKLKQKIKFNKRTIFIPQNKHKKLKTTMIVGGTAIVGGAVTFFTGGLAAPAAIAAVGAASGAALVDNESIDSDKKSGEQISKLLVDLQEAQKTIYEYNILKDSQTKLLNELNNLILNNQKNELILLLNKQSNLKKEIKYSYKTYISYTEISPYLAYADYYIYLADNHWFGHDNELKKSVKAISHGAYKDIILQANEDVRDQFYEVYSKLKEVAGSKEWEDLKVLQTLSNTMSVKKKTGIDLWWQ